MAGPLAGVKIIDLTSVGMGPYATQILADMGADVIKVESMTGDVVRHGAPSLHPGMGAFYMQVNRNKRRIDLALKAHNELEVHRNLRRDAAILVSNIR